MEVMEQKHPPKFSDDGVLLLPEPFDHDTFIALANYCEWWSKRHTEGWPETRTNFADGIATAYYSLAILLRKQVEHERYIASVKAQARWWWPIARWWNDLWRWM